MKCIDEPFSVYGDFSTNIASQLMVVFEKCDPALRQCEDEDVITKWMEFKYMIIMENEEEYMQTKPLGERV